MRRVCMWVVVMVLVALGLAACDGDSSAGAGSASTPATSEPSPATTTPDNPTTVESASTTEDPGFDGPLLPAELDPANFSNPTNVDNRWYPLVPGTQLVFDGSTLEDGEDEIAHRVIFTVTDLTKVIAGIETVVIWDEDYEEGDLVETEIAFFAQDDEGNVWLMGEYPEEYEDGVLDKAPAWIHGTLDSRAGILVPGNPQEGTPSFAQGWAPSVGWTDRGVIFEVGSATCVPVDCYEDVLIIDEFNPEEPGLFQVKYYAPGIGNVEVGFKGNDPSGETLELVEYKLLSEEELAEARAAALALEANAYTGSDIYQETEPILTPG